MIKLYPFRFKPLFRQYIWGGRRLESMLGKPLGDGDNYAESWEVSDHGRDQSVIAYGPLEGIALGEIVRRYPGDLYGSHVSPVASFPLLFKFLDAQKRLSVQVHPTDEEAAQLDPPDLGKTEAWYVIHAEPGSKIWSGLKRGFDQLALEREVQRDTCELCLHQWEPMPGDCVFIPAGTVHAVGEGLVIAELQQSSDTTFRLFDWNRVAADGKPRPLQIEQALRVIDYQQGPVGAVEPSVTSRPYVQRLVECDKFVWDSWTIDSPKRIGGDDRFHLIAVVEGTLQIERDPSSHPLVKGQTALLPTSCGPVQLTPKGQVTLLDAHLP